MKALPIGTEILLVLFGLNGVGHPQEPVSRKDECAMLYTDNDARRLVKAAEASVPIGKVLPKSHVLKILNIDITRLCNRRVEPSNNATRESWQMSPGFDLSWWAGLQDSTPLESDDRKIYFVRIVARSR